MVLSDIMRGDTPDVVHKVEAVESTATTTDVCALEAVLCAGEKTKADIAVEQIPHESAETENRIRYLYAEAPKHGIDPDDVAHSIYCESMWYSIQSGYIRADGVREDSWGLAQIHLPSHPDITREQALDAYWSIDWKLDNWDNETWYGYSRDTDECTNTIAEYWK
jgi:hypothetical protein